MTAPRARAFLAGLLAPLLAGAAPAPDLALPRSMLRCAGRDVRVTVQNLGDAASAPTSLEVRDRSAFGGTTGGSSFYPYTPNQAGIWLFQEPVDRRELHLSIGLGTGPDREAPAGSMQLRGAKRVRLEPALEGVRVQGAVVTWEPPPPGGRRIELRIAPATARAPEAEITLDVADRGDMPVFHGPDGDRPATRLTLRLDALQQKAAGRVVTEVPALAPGESREIAVRLPAAWPEVFARVDPEERVREIREGNNLASWRPDRERRSLAALHLHSSFSEGAGSVDWQAFHAAGSGYDLLWWSEHDWRLACRDHAQDISFDARARDSGFVIETEGTTASARVERSAPGEGSVGALALDVPAGGGVAVATVSERRKRFAYSLAAQLTLEVRVLVERLDADDRFSVLAELSQHPGEKRRIEYSFRWDGAPRGPADESDAVRPVVARTIATGSWVTVELPLSRDASSLWPNGLDSNVQGLRFVLRSAGTGATATVQSVRIRHDECGASLRRIQETWMEMYPNVAHQFADEVSFGRPHLNQYGGPRGLFDYEEVWDEARAPDLVERVHRSGGLVSWCHPFGVGSTRQARERFDPEYRVDLLQSRFGGSDVLEVGFRSKGVAELAGYLALWDDAGIRGTVVTGIGVNDSHERDWGPFENNFGTWLAAPADDPARLKDALAKGRAVFGDPLAFRGTLDLSCGEAQAGDVIGGAGPREVVARLAGGPPGAVVKLVADGKVRREATARSGAGRWSLRLGAGEARVVRAEAWSAAGEPLAFTNPVYFDVDGTLER